MIERTGAEGVQFRTITTHVDIDTGQVLRTRDTIGNNYILIKTTKNETSRSKSGAIRYINITKCWRKNPQQKLSFD